MDDKYTSKLSPTVDFWAGMYLVIIGKYAVLFHCLIVMSFLGIFLLCLPYPLEVKRHSQGCLCVNSYLSRSKTSRKLHHVNRQD